MKILLLLMSLWFIPQNDTMNIVTLTFINDRDVDTEITIYKEHDYSWVEINRYSIKSMDTLKVWVNGECSDYGYKDFEGGNGILRADYCANKLKDI